jgi:hypothetical protein
MAVEREPPPGRCSADARGDVRDRLAARQGICLDTRCTQPLRAQGGGGACIAGRIGAVHADEIAA